MFSLEKNSGIDFNNKVQDSKQENSFTFRNFYNGGGVAIGDINNDGYADVFLTSNMGENKLYLNKGKENKDRELKFEDITPKSGMKQDSMWSTGAVFADINHDGWLDLYVCSSGHMKDGNRRNKLYINNHDLTFTESAAKYGLDISAYTTQVSFFDYDLDGDLDCFMINNSPIPINTLGYANRRDMNEKDWPVAEFLKGGGDHLFRNDDGHFTEVTKNAGIHGTLMSFGLGVSVADINEDGYPDIFVANDSYERDYLYINQKNGSFKDQFEEQMSHASFSSMGADIADINNDGYQDIFTTDMLPGDDYRLKTLGAFDNFDVYRIKEKSGFYHQFMKNCLQLNDGGGRFCDIANFSGVEATDWSWGALIFDADNDGFNDIFVCNGVNKDVTNLDFMDFFANEVNQKMVATGEKENVDAVLKHIPVNPQPNKIFRNLGTLQFEDAGKAWGMSDPSFSNGAAYADLDNDGDLDLVINNENQPAFVYRNNAREQNGNHYISVLLKGSGKNTYAIGSKIRLYAGGSVYYREVMPSRGFQSSVDYVQVIGLGKLSGVDSMVITWPDGRRSRYREPALDKEYRLDETREAKEEAGQGVKRAAVLLDSVGSSFVRHREDDHVDFYYERNIPELLSREGPRAAVGDVNGDGLQDVYIAGGKGQGGALYLQQAGGGWKPQQQKVFGEYSDFEDVAVVLFDADGDKDLDLFIGSGGNASAAGSRELQHRLYVNDGRGNFSIDVNAFESNEGNIGAVVAGDFDGDGDQDLFVGGRSVPQSYGSTPQSYVYLNDGKGHFKDIARTQTPALSQVGMVTGAVWSGGELVVVGEWMSPRIFKFNKNRFEEVKTNLEGMKGWWQTVVATDLDGDGREDLVLGNMGENFYLRPTPKEPVKLWLNDFDQNGTMDKILTRSIEGRDVPVFLKREVEEQLPVLKKQNLHHRDYAMRTVEDLFGKAVLEKSVEKEFTYSSSCIAWNQGGGKYEVEKLEGMAQLSSVNAVLSVDVNGDGRKDLLVGGNRYGFPPQFGRLDGSYGDVLVSEGKRKFRWLSPVQTGLRVRGEVRDMKEIRDSGGSDYVLYLINDDYPRMYRVNHK